MKTLVSLGLLWGIGILLASPLAQASSECQTRSGDLVVVNIGRDDPIGGLAVRAAPSRQAPIKTVIPAAGTGVAIGSCHGDGWCEVTFECVRGWSLAARYLAPRDQRLYRVTNVSPNDPEGLTFVVARDWPTHQRETSHTTAMASSFTTAKRMDVGASNIWRNIGMVGAPAFGTDDGQRDKFRSKRICAFPAANRWQRGGWSGKRRRHVQSPSDNQWSTNAQIRRG